MTSDQSAPEPLDTELKICLYVAGNAPTARLAKSALKELTHGGEGKPLPFEVVDVLLHPERALAVELLATPTLIIQQGTSLLRFVGDLSARKDLTQTIAEYRNLGGNIKSPC